MSYSKSGKKRTLTEEEEKGKGKGKGKEKIFANSIPYQIADIQVLCSVW
jgi:hypothetical protein